MQRQLLLFFIFLMLTSCSALSGTDSSNTNGGQAVNPAPLVEWDRSPATVVFRTEVVGGEDEDAFYRRNEVPLCTIYGDGRIVWRIDRTVGAQILFDTLTDDQISRFIQALTVEQQIYTFGTEADFQIPTEINPAYEQMTINVNGQMHITDSFSDWTPDYFRGIVEQCQTLAETPTIYEPEGAWVSVQATTYVDSAPVVPWSNEASGLNIAQLAESGERQWISGRNLRVLWRVIQESSQDLLFSEVGGPYQIVLEVPNVTINAPAPPPAS